jgi:ring-1,2-phenylacetyl-CoA epoxidase subunit PaaC
MELQKALYQYSLRLGDSALISGHRLSEWCGKAPLLEEDIALTNIALDMVGRSRSILEYAATLSEQKTNEDQLAYFRNAMQYRNYLLCEQPNKDYGYTLMKNFIFSVFSFYQYKAFENSSNEYLKALAIKSLKEIKYHVTHNTEWIKRLGDGTELSNKMMQEALNELWRYTHDFFDDDEIENTLIENKIIESSESFKNKFIEHCTLVFEEATLSMPTETLWAKGSRKGLHSEHLSYLLGEMQSVARMYPDANWD